MSENSALTGCSMMNLVLEKAEDTQALPQVYNWLLKSDTNLKGF